MKAAQERRIGLLFISPFLIGFTVFTVYPVCASRRRRLNRGMKC